MDSDDDKKLAEETEKAEKDIEESANGILPNLTAQLGVAMAKVCDDCKLSRRQRILVAASVLAAMTEGEMHEFQYAIAATGKFFDYGRMNMDAIFGSKKETDDKDGN